MPPMKRGEARRSDLRHVSQPRTAQVQFAVAHGEKLTVSAANAAK